MKHKIYINGNLVCESRFKFLCDIMFSYYIKNKNKNDIITMISDYTKKE